MEQEQRHLHKNNAVSVDFWELSPLDLIHLDELILDLPTEKTLVFKAVQEIPRQVGFFHGEVDDGKKIINFISTEDKSFFGSIIDMLEHKVYQFQPKADGKMHVIKKTVSDFIDHDDKLSAQQLNLNRNKTQLSIFEGNEGTNSDLGDVIDVMIVWTKTSECRNSGLIEDCILTAVTKSNMMGKIRLAIEETNSAFIRSGIGTRLRLVYAYLHPTYQESDLATSLNHLTDGHDGVLDDVHEKRAKYGADAVSLWIDSIACGLGWIGPFKEFMFSVVNYSCATGYFSFGHELAHNIGCKHDRGTEDKCNENDIPSYGYRDHNSAFRDIMAYDCVPGQCDNNAEHLCSRLQRFSNTYVLYEGRALGDDRNNCARHINSKLSIVASYFARKTDEELATLRAFETDQERSEIPETKCKESKSHCNRDDLCCSHICRWRQCQ